MDLRQQASHGGVVPRAVIEFINPALEVNAGIWFLFAGATAFLGLRLWSKAARKHGFWYDDYILIACWVSATPSPTPPPYSQVRFAPTYPEPATDVESRSSC